MRVRTLTVRLRGDSFFPSIETPLNVPVSEMDSRIEWIGQRFLALILTMLLQTTLFAVLLGAVLTILRSNHEMMGSALGIGVLSYFITLPFMLIIGYQSTFNESREELQEVWTTLPWFEF